MKRLISTIALLTLTVFTVVARPAKKYDVYLLIGQSNMAGRGYLTDEDKKEVVDGVFLLGPEDTPVPATHPFNQYSTIRKHIGMQQMGPGYSFAKVMKQHSKRPILLVYNAKGGTTIAEWGEGTEFFNEAVRRTLEAKKFGKLKGIVWHQGCGDSGSRVDTYMESLKAMVSALRRDLKASKVPFIAGELPYWRPTSENFNKMIRTISDNIPNSAWVSAEGCGMRAEPKDPHFSREGQIILGERYAEKMLQMK